MSEKKTKSCEHITSPLECLDVKIDANDKRSKECMFFFTQFLKEKERACHHDSCNVKIHENSRKNNN